MKSSIIIITLTLFSSTALTTTAGFQLALTSKLINNLTRSRTKTSSPSTIVTVAPRKTSSINSSGRISKKLFGRRNLLNKSIATPHPPMPTQTSISLSTHRKDDITTQVNNNNNNNKKIDNKRIIALVTTSCLLLNIIHRPNVAYAASTTIPPSSSLPLLSSISLIDPGTLTTTTEGLSVLNSNIINNNNNLLSKLITTTLATIQMKQQSMAMFALAMFMTMVLFRCAEGGYVKLVEFMADKVCLGYYGMNLERGSAVKKKKVGWNEYVLRLKRRKDAVDKDDEHHGKAILNGKTMLFERLPTKVIRGRGDDDIMMERANQSYREKQHEQHEHCQDTEQSTFLDTPPTSPSSSSWDKYKSTLNKLTQTQAEHDETSEKLQILKNLVTWQDYKHLVTELQIKKEECSKLKDEVDSLMRLLQVERSVHSHQQQQQQYRTAPDVSPDVVVDSSGGGGGDYEKELELKTLADKAKEYDETMQESKVKNGDSVRWH